MKSWYLTIPFEKSKTVSFASLITKNIVEPSALSKFPVELICCIAFYLFQLIVLLKPDSNGLRIFMFSWLHKVTTGT